MSSDITDLILNHHRWFREQFVRLYDVYGDGGSNTEELRQVWDPLAALLDLHAVAEEELFYPQLLRKGTDDPEEATLDAIGDHNDIRDGVHEAEAAEFGSPEWWTGVTKAREANDEHMAEEEREGIADFRQHASVELRESLGEQFARFFVEHPTTSGVNVSDKDPQDYVDTVEAEIEEEQPAKG